LYIHLYNVISIKLCKLTHVNRLIYTTWLTNDIAGNLLVVL